MTATANTAPMAVKPKSFQSHLPPSCLLSVYSLTPPAMTPLKQPHRPANKFCVSNQQGRAITKAMPNPAAICLILSFIINHC